MKNVIQVGLKRLFVLLQCVLVVSLVACGGGGGGSPAASVTPNGIWTGTGSEAGTTFDLQGVIFNGQIRAFSLTAGFIYTGNIAMNGNQMSGTVTLLQIGGGPVGSVGIQATVVPEVSINGTDSDGATFNLQFYSLYNRTPDLNTVAGNYILSDGAGFLFQMTVQSNGNYTASDTDGCLYSGSITPADGVHNLYNFTMAVTNCGAANGNYTGHSFMDDDVVANDTLWLIGEDANLIFIAAVSKI